MEWLKAILEKAKVADDGKLDVEDLMKNISAEFPKHAVPKSEYNAKAEELKAANTTIENLKKSNKDNEKLQTEIEGYKSQIKTLQDAEVSTKKTYALKDVLKEKGCLDPDYLIYKHGGLDKFNFDSDGKPIGVDELLKPYKESSPMLFQKQQQYKPGAGGEVHANPFAKDTWNLTEQGKLYRENPAQAREMAAAAGVEI